MGNELINFRKSEGLSLKEMAAKIGVSNSFYEKIERGERNPSYNFTKAFKVAFPGIKADGIFFT